MKRILFIYFLPFYEVNNANKFYQLPIVLNNWEYWEYLNNTHENFKFKIKNYLFIKYKTSTVFWMDRKKNIPKFLKNAWIFRRAINYSIINDRITQSFLNLKKKFLIKDNSYIQDNKIFKQFIFRFKGT